MEIKTLDFFDICLDYLKDIQGLLYKVYTLPEDVLVKRLIQCIDEGGYHVDLLIEGKEVLGLCLYKEDYNMHTGSIIRIDTLVVKEQGLGYGSELLKKFTDDTIQLECHVDNLEGQKFYEARNFIRRAYSYVR